MVGGIPKSVHPLALAPAPGDDQQLGVGTQEHLFQLISTSKMFRSALIARRFSSAAAGGKTFRVLGLQQIAIGALDKKELTRL